MVIRAHFGVILLLKQLFATNLNYYLYNLRNKRLLRQVSYCMKQITDYEINVQIRV